MCQRWDIKRGLSTSLTASVIAPSSSKIATREAESVEAMVETKVSRAQATKLRTRLDEVIRVNYIFHSECKRENIRQRFRINEEQH